MIIIAHRGFSSKYYDNNLMSFKKAMDTSFTMVEMDIRLNKENELVIYHDNSVNNKLIKNMSNNEIKRNSILFLSDFFENIELKKNIILDLKGSNDQLEFILYHFLQKNNIPLHKIIIASFNHIYLDHLFKMDKSLNLGYISANGNIDHQYINNYSYILLDITTINHDLVNYLKSMGKIIYCYTCHSECEKELFYAYNIDGIISNVK